MRALLALALAVLVTLKVGGVLHCSWWWVLTPAWVPAATVLLYVAAILLVSLAAHAIKGDPEP